MSSFNAFNINPNIGSQTVRRNQPAGGLPQGLTLNPLTGEFIPASATTTRFPASPFPQLIPQQMAEAQTQLSTTRQGAPPGVEISAGRFSQQQQPAGQFFQPGPQQQAGVAPPTGLIGAEQALFGGAQGAIGAVQGAGAVGRQDITGGQVGALQQLGGATQALQQGQEQGLQFLGGATEQAVSPLQGFIDPGQRSIDLQADLSGANGPQAQAAAFAAFQQDPGTQFLAQEQEQALIRNAAATGGLGGGRIRQALQRNAFSRAQTDLQRRIGNLQGISGQGLQAAGQVGQLRGQQAIAGTSLIGQGAVAQADIQTLAANVEQSTGVNLAQLEQQTGVNVGQILENLGSQSAEVRTQAGQDLSNAIQTASGQLADLQQNLGAGVSDINAGQIQNIGNLLIDRGLADANSERQLATILGNLAVGQGTLAANIASNIGQINAAGVLGQGTAIATAITELGKDEGVTDFLEGLFS